MAAMRRRRAALQPAARSTLTLHAPLFRSSVHLLRC
jgi:hypothetical protein